MNDVVLSAQSVSRTYKEADTEIHILKQLSLEVKQGQRVAIIGSSGSGKSTLLNILGGLDKPDEGEVVVGGHPLYSVNDKQRNRIRNTQLGFVYQFHHLLHEFSALENVAMPLLIGGTTVSAAREKAASALKRVGLEHRLSHKPAKLSGGERQRVAIARALVTEPACVLMDEPTGNLDRRTASDIEQFIMQLNQSLNIAFITVTHDLAFAERMDIQYELKEGTLTIM